MPKQDSGLLTSCSTVPTSVGAHVSGIGTFPSSSRAFTNFVTLRKRYHNLISGLARAREEKKNFIVIKVSYGLLTSAPLFKRWPDAQGQSIFAAAVSPLSLASLVLPANWGGLRRLPRRGTEPACWVADLVSYCIHFPVQGSPVASSLGHSSNLHSGNF